MKSGSWPRASAGGFVGMLDTGGTSLVLLAGVKLTLIGAGGFRTPAIYRALVTEAGTIRFDEVVLFDPDTERLQQIGAVLAGIDAELGDRVAHRSSGDLRDALDGADVVYCAIRVGGLEGRLLDERIAVGAGGIGQETTGAGGI